MGDNTQPQSLEELCDRVAKADTAADDRFRLDAILEMVGRRSFGPLLLVAGLIAIVPFLGDVPGVTTLVGVLVLLIAIQMVVGRSHFWLPQFLLQRSIDRERLCRALDRVRPAARFVDRFTRPRLRALTEGAGAYVIALVCAAIALIMPAMEVVPFGANVAGAALTMFGLSIIAHDGLVAVIAFVFTALTLGLAGYGLLL